MAEPRITLPVLTIKTNVLFPEIVMPIAVGRPRSIAAVESSLSTEEKEILVVAQRDASVEQPTPDDLFSVGTTAVIKKAARTPEGQMRLVVQGMDRAEILQFVPDDRFLRAEARNAPIDTKGDVETEALHQEVLKHMEELLRLVQPGEATSPETILGSVSDIRRLVYMLGAMLTLDVEKEQALLEAKTLKEALTLVHGYLTHEVQVMKVRGEIASQAHTEMSKQQREYLLRQQLRAIQSELGESDDRMAEVALLRERVQGADLPEHVRKEIERELTHLERLPDGSAEHNVVRSYLELVLDLPWRKSSDDIVDTKRARRILDEDHHDLEEIKERILEHLAVLELNPKAKAPILCFVGPPGVGKTSLGQSIARALQRRFERMSLGDLHDEAELRGHRRTYVGAMPGRIIQAIRRAGVNNPVIMLDEVDKLGRDFRGDPAAALLEILDPEQNRDFRDNYLDLAFDLSSVLFITTANTLDSIPRPLLDRMEVLRLAGYSDEDKLEIARLYLIPRQLEESGLGGDRCTIPDDTLRHVIRRYTREAGLRQLERMIARLFRKVALRLAEGEKGPIEPRPDDLHDLLGPEPFFADELRQDVPPGVATGLAWTESGGTVLSIEAIRLPDKKDLVLTGQLGDVMKESARAAESYVWSHAEDLGIDRDRMRDSGVHIHVPAGAIPKDGPSAGVALLSALASLHAGRPTRRDTAMTGEITLTGLVLPVGGIKEKVLAARRAGIKRVVLPKQNEKDLRDLPEYVRDEIEFVLVDRVDELLAATLPGPAESLSPAGAAR